MKMQKDYIYQQISRNIAQLIKDGVLKAGDKLPSVRTICREHGVSMNTATRVYLELESKGLITARPQSGFYVSIKTPRQLPLPAASNPSGADGRSLAVQLISKVYSGMGKKDLTLFSISAPAASLLPVDKLKKSLLRAARSLHDNNTTYEPLQGNERLRRAIARRTFMWGGSLTEKDIITTSGAMNAVSLCMMALSKAGDTIAVESPLYPGILQLARSLGLHVLELPTHPQTGIDPAALEQAIPQIDLCLLVSNFSSPLGSCIPEENKKRIVQLLDKHHIPLIEDDLYGDLYFGNARPRSCKTFDKTGNVLWCGSISKTLAPGYRVGWVSPGRYKEQVLQQKFVHGMSNTAITQEAVADFLESGGYDHHLRKLRDTLYTNCMHYTNTIAAHFPAGTKTSRPQGGLALWVELNKKTDTAVLYENAIRQKISIAPGRMFSLQSQFDHCMRLCFGLPWSDQVQRQLKQLGKIAGNMLS